MPIVISNNLRGKIPIPLDAIIRVNLAWFPNIEDAEKVVKKSKFPIYLDYPDGRTKPPKPTLTLEEAMKLANVWKVKYFAVSNAEDMDKIRMINSKIECELVPKIETKKGAGIMEELIAEGIKTVMLDKEDLYVNCGADPETYNQYITYIRSFGDRIKILEMAGVVFI